MGLKLNVGQIIRDCRRISSRARWQRWRLHLPRQVPPFPYPGSRSAWRSSSEAAPAPAASSQTPPSVPEALAQCRPHRFVVVAAGVVAGVAAAAVPAVVVAAAAVAERLRRAESGLRRTPAGCAAEWGQGAELVGPARRRRCS